MLKADYTKLAKYYDFLQQEIDYNVWVEFFQKNISELPKSNQRLKVLEIGSGTGKFAELIDLEEIDYTGFDLSPEMIKIAQSKKLNAEFFVDDATKFDLKMQYDVIICFMDTINYITTDSKLNATFKNVCKHLKVGGIFLFDIHKQSNLENFDDYQEIGYIDDVQYIWHSKQIDEIHVNHFFTFIDEDGQIDECHEQMIAAKAYYEQTLQKYFKIVKATSDDYREYFVVKKMSDK